MNHTKFRKKKIILCPRALKEGQGWHAPPKPTTRLIFVAKVRIVEPSQVKVVLVTMVRKRM